MKKYLRVLFGFAMVWHTCDAVNALEISGNTVVSGTYFLNEDTTVLNNSLFSANNIQTINSLTITNYGQISGKINVCTNCMVEVRNTGIFDADVLLQPGAHFVQVISENDEITNLGLSSEYDVVVRDGNDLNFAEVVSVASNANSVELANADFDAGSFNDFSAPSGIKLTGDIILHFDNVTNSPKKLFANVSGDGVVHADSIAVDSLHIVHTYRDNNDIFVRLVRSTNYARILNNDTGGFLDKLRALGADDKLFAKLDVAQSMEEINNILSRSVRTTPINLMQPISLINSYQILEIMHIDDATVFGFEPVIIYSNDVLIRGIQPNVSFNTGDVHLKLYGYVADVNYSDDFNEYGGIAYGIGVDAQYDVSDKELIRAHIGGGKSYFDVGYVFDGTSIVNNPKGMALYAAGEYGYMFLLDNGYKLTPFVGGGAEYKTVANTDDTNVFGIGGVDINREYEFDGLRYNYALRAIARTDSVIGAGLGISVWSIIDDAGGIVHLDAMHDNDFGMSYKLSINGIFRF